MRRAEDILKEQQDLFGGKGKYVTTEFQDYGYRLAIRLNDLPHKALYIKLAKNEPRALIENALSFAADYPKAKNKAKIFMWKLKELKDSAKGDASASSAQGQGAKKDLTQ
ncbi:MAG: hypothetical protein ABIC57_01180 [bacterium]